MPVTTRAVVVAKAPFRQITPLPARLQKVEVLQGRFRFAVANRFHSFRSCDGVGLADGKEREPLRADLLEKSLRQ